MFLMFDYTYAKILIIVCTGTIQLFTAQFPVVATLKKKESFENAVEYGGKCG